MKNNAEIKMENLTDSPWQNTYWFAWMLVNGDKYGAVGTAKEAKVIDLANQLEIILAQASLAEQEKVAVCRDILEETILSFFRKESKGYVQAELFFNDLNIEIKTIADILVLIITIRYMLAPVNTSLRFIPSDDLEFCHSTAKHILDSLGETSIGKLLSTWDNLGVRGCLDVERRFVVSEFTKLRTNLRALDFTMSEFEDNIVLTAFVQEFERRLGQKRKARAGSSLEDVATFLFDYYGFSSHPRPDHFQTDIEVDKWFKCRDGWSVGISCKRTLRERWKQVSSADSHALSRYMIKEIWHLTTYDKDLSDEKLTMLGQQRQVFYLDDRSERYKSAFAHVGMKDYVRPLSTLIEDIRREQRG